METLILQLGLSIPGMFLSLLAGIIIVKGGKASRKICVTTKYQFKKRQFSCTLTGEHPISYCSSLGLNSQKRVPFSANWWAFYGFGQVLGR